MEVRVYISADMEGITGLVDADDVQADGRDYERGRAMMTQDVNAAVGGALAGGATRVLVNDAHSAMRNLLVDQLHPAAALVRGRPKPMGMLEGLDERHAATLCVGYHARAGQLGVLSHSYFGHEIEDMWLDGRPVGEIGFAHATAAALGAPVAMLSGDDVACAEARAWAADAEPPVRTAVVKYARDRFAAELLPVAVAHAAIAEAAEEGVRTALARAGDGGNRPRAAHMALAVRWQSASVAEQLMGIPGVSRRDDRTVEVTGDVVRLFRLFGVFQRVAASLTGQRPYC